MLLLASTLLLGNSVKAQPQETVKWAMTDYELKYSEERDKRLPPEKVMDSIGLEPGMVIGEAGAGNGYYTFKLRDRIGKGGAIYANDILPGDDIEDRCRHAGIKNIYTVLGKVDDALFPRDDLEMVVVALCFHDFTEPVRWLKNLKKYLRPDAEVAIIDGDPQKSGNPHHVSRKRVIDYFQQAGYEAIEGVDDSFLEEDMILVFRLNTS
jgi:ubiquinone/menaquinone biosynthesis C-methylase UbiE